MKVGLTLLLGATRAPAQSELPATPEPLQARSHVTGTLALLAGAAAGLAIHESGHVISGAAFGAHPRVRSLEGSLIPFFRIAHDHVSPRKEFVISSAGLWMQYFDAEWLLTARPHLRQEGARFLQGMLAIDLATSTVYSIAAFSRTGPAERDTRSIAESLGRTGAPEPIVGFMVLAPAALDGLRYLRPQARWATWASRGVKVASVMLTMAAGK